MSSNSATPLPLQSEDGNARSRRRGVGGCQRRGKRKDDRTAGKKLREGAVLILAMSLYRARRCDHRGPISGEPLCDLSF